MGPWEERGENGGAGEARTPPGCIPTLTPRPRFHGRQDLFTTFSITELQETTLAANQLLAKASRLQWAAKAGGCRK